MFKCVCHKRKITQLTQIYLINDHPRGELFKTISQLTVSSDHPKKASLFLEINQTGKVSTMNMCSIQTGIIFSTNKQITEIVWLL